jgi:hypothetical protein
MSFRSKQELLQQIAPRYQEASELQKVVILNEFVAATGYARKYAIRRLNHPGVPHLKIERPRVPRFGPEVQETLHLAWLAANRICAKRLVPFLPTLVESLERHGHLRLTPEVCTQLLTISSATADRSLASLSSAPTDSFDDAGGHSSQETDPHSHLSWLGRCPARLPGN